MNAHPHKSGLVPEGLGYRTVAPFLYLTLTTLALLGAERTVRQYAEANPDAIHAIRALSTRVVQAGIRVRDTAKYPSLSDEHMKMFTAEEFWMFNLAVDVIAMFATSGGLRPNTHAQVISDLRTLDEDAHSHHWKSQVRKAGNGPAEFRELRAHIPHHEPHPR